MISTNMTLKNGLCLLPAITPVISPFFKKISQVGQKHFSTTPTPISKSVLKNLRIRLDEKVIGQSHATKAIADALSLHIAGLSHPKLPIANLLFLGPTGVGKTELAKVLAEEVYGHSKALLRFDMSKYTRADYVSGLVGTTQGFVGYEEGGLLTGPVIENPNRIILFDELEKAHSSIYKVLLSVTGSGEISDHHGKTAFFNKSIIISTSNLLSQEIQELFNKNIPPEAIERKLRSHFMQHFSPEFYGRVSAPIIFYPASKTHLKGVIKKMLKEVKKRIEDKLHIYLTFDESIPNYIQNKGFSSSLGFRPTARFIEKEIILPLAGLLNDEKIIKGSAYHVHYEKVTERQEFRKSPDMEMDEIEEENGRVQFTLIGETASIQPFYSKLIQEIKNYIVEKKWKEAQSLYEKHKKLFLDSKDPDLVEIAFTLAKHDVQTTDSLERAFRIFQNYALKGNSEALANLATMYLYGEGVTKDIPKAIELFKKAAELDHPLANFHMGKFYLQARYGHEWNPSLAEQHFNKAVAKGSHEIVNWIGVIYIDNPHIPNAKEKAYNYFKRAIELGSSWAYHNLAREYLIDAEKDKSKLPKAVEYFLKAGKLGIKNSYVYLADIHRDGKAGAPKNSELVEKYEKLSEKVKETEEKKDNFIGSVKNIFNKSR